ncbi:imidazolonepropionase [Vibrio maerlii]|uniref:imidazolonepropionase n=1 Tax=Vibrio maerlii TaxID=2231648 RepID=UPI000E3EA3D1|nr:imidazolonepropionase [Vibrio maerlii]
MNTSLINARLVTCQPGYEGYQPSPLSKVVIKDGLIDAVGPMEQSIEDDDQSLSIDCEGKLLTPGFIDCHTHLIFAGQRSNEFEQRLNGQSYQDILNAGGGILSTVRETRKASHQELLDLALPRLDGLISSGVTSIEVKSGYGLTLEDELKMLRVAKDLSQHRAIKVSTTLLAAHTLPPEYSHRSDDYVDLICEEIIPHAAEHRLADSIDVFCESIGFNLSQTERIFKSAHQHGLPIKGHTEQLSNLGGSALAAKYSALSVDHIEYLDAIGVEAIARSGTVATLLPGAFYFLNEQQHPPIELLRAANVPMALATDLNPGTSPFANLLLMLNMGCTLFGLTPEEALRGVTCHAAKALGLSESRGQIAVGYEADFTLWDIQSPAELSYQFGVPILSSRIVDGVRIND